MTRKILAAIVFLVTLVIFQVGGQAEERERANDANKIEFNLEAQTEVEVLAGEPIRFIDLVQIDKNTFDYTEATQKIIHEPLFADEEVLLSRTDLAKILREKMSELEHEVTLILPEQIKIRALGQKIPLQRVQKEILSAAFRKCVDCQIKIQSLKMPTFENRSQIFGYSLDISLLKSFGSFLVPMKLRYENQEKTVYITGQLETSTKALVTARAIIMGEKITEQDIKNEVFEIKYSHDALATNEDLRGKVLNKTLALGRPIYKSDLKKEVAVTRGQMVRVLSGNEVFEVSNQMIAEDNGGVGDFIKLKNPETQKTTSGEILDKGIVRIQ